MTLSEYLAIGGVITGSLALLGMLICSAALLAQQHRKDKNL
jgi:hypothetical protein